MHTVVSEEFSAGSTRIHCPVCKTRDVSGEVIEMEETLMQYLVIPTRTHTTWWVVCSQCRIKLFSKAGPAELQTRGADELVGRVYLRTSLIHRFLALAACLLIWAPALGLVMSVIARVVNRKSPGWPRKASKIALLISIFVQMGFGALLLIGALTK